MKNKQKGLFITLEGIDGSGKSTLASKIEAYLTQNQIPCFLTAEPTQGDIGIMIRNMLKKRNQQELHALTELFLFSADRTVHIQEMIHYLNQGFWVICDRYVDSTIAYQGRDENLLKIVYTISGVLFDLLKPDLTILLDIGPDDSLHRIDGRVKDFYEQATYLKKVRERYLEQALEEKDRIRVVNGNQKPDTVAKLAFIAIEEARRQTASARGVKL